MSSAYQLLVEGLVGKVDSVCSRGRPAGNVMLAQCNVSARNNAAWQVNFGLSYLPNPVGEITAAAKDGMDPLRVEYETNYGD